jgi:hypothetical protein
MTRTGQSVFYGWLVPSGVIGMDFYPTSMLAHELRNRTGRSLFESVGNRFANPFILLLATSGDVSWPWHGRARETTCREMWSFDSLPAREHRLDYPADLGA